MGEPIGRDPQELAQMLDKFIALEDLTLKLPAMETLNAIGLIQLALRHPTVQDTAQHIEIGVTIVQRLSAPLLERMPELAPIIEAGWNPAADDPQARLLEEAYQQVMNALRGEC